MRALDCSHEAHDDMHFTADTDEALVEQVKRHRDEYHPQMSDEAVEQAVAQGAYDE